MSESDEDSHRDDRAHYAEEHGGCCFLLSDVVPQSKHEHNRHGRNGCRQYRLTDSRIAIADTSQATQNQGGLNDVLRNTKNRTYRLTLILPDVSTIPQAKSVTPPGAWA